MRVYFVWKYEYEGDSHHAIYSTREAAEAHAREYEERFPTGHGVPQLHIDEFEVLLGFDPKRVGEFGLGD